MFLSSCRILLILNLVFHPGICTNCRENTTRCPKKTLLKDKCDYLTIKKRFLGHPVFPKILTFVLSQIEVAISYDTPTLVIF